MTDFFPFVWKWRFSLKVIDMGDLRVVLGEKLHFLQSLWSRVKLITYCGNTSSWPLLMRFWTFNLDIPLGSRPSKCKQKRCNSLHIQYVYAWITKWTIYNTVIASSCSKGSLGADQEVIGRCSWSGWSKQRLASNSPCVCGGVSYWLELGQFLDTAWPFKVSMRLKHPAFWNGVQSCSHSPRKLIPQKDIKSNNNYEKYLDIKLFVHLSERPIKMGRVVQSQIRRSHSLQARSRWAWGRGWRRSNIPQTDSPSTSYTPRSRSRNCQQCLGCCFRNCWQSSSTHKTWAECTWTLLTHTLPRCMQRPMITRTPTRTTAADTSFLPSAWVQCSFTVLVVTNLSYLQPTGTYFISDEPRISETPAISLIFWDWKHLCFLASCFSLQQLLTTKVLWAAAATVVTSG